MEKIKFKIYMTSFALVLFCIFEPLILFVSGYFAGWIFFLQISAFQSFDELLPPSIFAISSYFSFNSSYMERISPAA